MTQEEKAKAYDEALERFKSFKERYYTRNTHFGDVIFDKNGEMQKDFEEIFPELRESEDERIRTTLVKYFKRFNQEDMWNSEVSLKDIVAYLEKQKEEPKPAEWNANDKAFIKDCANILVANDYAASAERLLSMFPVKPAEWSEEDEENFKWFDKFFRAESVVLGGKEISQDKYLWFKSLRPSWRPSEEQMEALERTIRLANFGAEEDRRKVLESLYEQLKQL